MEYRNKYNIYRMVFDQSYISAFLLALANIWNKVGWFAGLETPFNRVYIFKK